MDKEPMNLKKSDDIDKRKSPRVKFHFEVYYPHVNNKWESENIGSDVPVIETINISDSGICFLSRVKLEAGDFISFLIRIEDYPSFPCLGEIKWVEPKENDFIVGCQFYTLSDVQIDVIRRYIEKENNAEGKGVTIKQINE